MNLSGVGEESLAHMVQSSKALFFQHHVIFDCKRAYLIAFLSPNAVTQELKNAIAKYSGSERLYRHARLRGVEQCVCKK